jgi:hypothetical protein
LAEAEKYELAWCLRHQRQGSSISLASCHPDPETTSKFVASDDEAKTRWPNGNARTLPLVYRIRSEFRNRKLQETRSRCRLIERRIEPRATRIIDVRATLFFA